METLNIVEVRHEPRVSSELLADQLGITHKAVINTVNKYLDRFEKSKRVVFKIQPFETKGGTQKRKVALLTEEQSYALLTLSKNTERVVSAKFALAEAFERFRRNQQQAADYLPFYHEVHEAVKIIAGQSKTNPRIFHMNYNRLANKAAGITAGRRQDLSVTERMNITAVQAVIAATVQRGVYTGMDHHDIYQQAKTAANNAVYVKPLMIQGGN